MPNIKENELQALLQEMSEDLEKAYDLEKERLVKAAEDKEPEKDSAPVESSDESSSPAESAPVESSDSSAPAEAPPMADTSAPAAGPADGAAPMDPAAAGMDQSAPLTPEALQAEYSQLAPEELDMHIKAALAAKEALAASAAPMGDASAMPPAAPAASPSPSPAPAGPPAMKSELKVDKKAIGGKMVPVKKSEDEIDPRDAKISALEDLVKSQSEDIEILTKSVKMVMEQPVRKAITSVAYVPKVEADPKAFSAADVQKLIKDNAHKLSKAERDLVLEFYDGKVPAAKLEPVLEKLSTSK